MLEGKIGTYTESVLTNERHTTRLVSDPKLAAEFEKHLITLFDDLESWKCPMQENRFPILITGFIAILKKIKNKHFENLDTTINLASKISDNPGIIPAIESLIEVCNRFLHDIKMPKKQNPHVNRTPKAHQVSTPIQTPSPLSKYKNAVTPSSKICVFSIWASAFTA